MQLPQGGGCVVFRFCQYSVFSALYTSTDHNIAHAYYYSDHLGPPEQGGILFLMGLPRHGAEPGAPSPAPCW